MTEREWSFRRRLPGARAWMRDKAMRATDYIAIMVWISLCCGAWSIVALLLWRWFVSVPFGIRPIGIAESIGIALVGWVFREAAFGDTERPVMDDVAMQARRMCFVLVLGWVLHFFVPGA